MKLHQIASAFLLDLANGSADFDTDEWFDNRHIDKRAKRQVTKMLYQAGLIDGIDASAASGFYLMDIEVTVAGLHQAEVWPRPTSATHANLTITDSQIAIGDSNTQTTTTEG